MVCGVCGVKGHNKRTCGRVVFVSKVASITPEMIPRIVQLAGWALYRDKSLKGEWESDEKYAKRYVKVCEEGDYPKGSWEVELEKAMYPKVLAIMDEDPMEEDYVLTDDEDEYEVDIATPDWGNLPLEVVDIIIGKVEESNTEYWTSKYLMIRGLEYPLERGGVAHNMAMCGSDLRQIVMSLDYHHKTLTPKNMKYKYLIGKTKYHRGARAPARRGRYSWYHTLAAREGSIRHDAWSSRSE